MQFIHDPLKLMLVVTVNHYGGLIALETLSKTLPYKGCYFIRKTLPLPLNQTNFRELLIYGDTTTHTVEELAVVVEEVYYPLLNNQANQVSWPEELQKDIEAKVQLLRDVVSEAKGTLMQKTVLPQPFILNQLMELRVQILEERRHELCDVKLRNAVESIVNKWCIQINDVLQRNDLQKSQPTLSARQLTPDMEIAFWQMRLDNLENIYEQLQQDKCRTAVVVLERIQSFRSTEFRATFRALVQGVEEARDITLWLKPLVSYNPRMSDGLLIIL